MSCCSPLLKRTHDYDSPVKDAKVGDLSLPFLARRFLALEPFQRLRRPPGP